MDDDKRLDQLGAKLDALTIKVSEMHTALFGVEGQGGLYPWIRDHDKDITELQQQKNKMIGAAIIIGLLIGVVATSFLKSL